MLDRAYLAQLMPLGVVWGRNDHMIPFNHAYRAVTHVERSEVHVFERSGHFPHKDQAERSPRSLPSSSSPTRRRGTTGEAGARSCSAATGRS
jgi:hypothetical protein